MSDDRELGKREILSGKVTVEQAARMRHSTPQPAPPVAAPATAPPAIPGDAEPEVKPPVVTNSPAEGRKFPCKQCGARLDFDPSERALKCPYCGHVEEIAPAKTGITEHDYAQALAKIPADQGAIPGRSSEVRCPGCGANVLIEDNVETQTCPFCATHLVNVPRAAATAMILPECILPFRISERQAIEAFNAWIKTRWFAPNALKTLANLGQLSGHLHAAFWTS